MLAIVEVHSDHVDEIKGISAKTTRAYLIRNQDAYIHNGGPYPEKFRLSLVEGQVGYPPGKYVIAGGSYERDRANGNSFIMGRNWALLPIASALGLLTDLVAADKPKVVPQAPAKVA